MEGQRKYTLRVSILQSLMTDGVITQQQYLHKKEETKEEIFGEVGYTNLTTPRTPGLPQRDASHYVQDFEEKLKEEEDTNRVQRISMRQIHVKKQLEKEISQKEKKRSDMVNQLEQKFIKSFAIEEAARKRLSKEDEEIRRMELEITSEEEKLRELQKRRRTTTTVPTTSAPTTSVATTQKRTEEGEGVVSEEGGSSSSSEEETEEKKRKRIVREITSEEALQLFRGNPELLQLEAELFGEETKYEETNQEKEEYQKINIKKQELEEKKKKRFEFYEKERKRILKEEEEIKKMEKELLQEEAAFDRDLEERRRKRQQEDDYDWNDVTNDPLASGSEGEEVEDEETTRIVQSNEEVRRLEAEIFG